MHRPIRNALAAAALAAAAQASAQDAGQDDAIVVTGKTEAEQRRQTYDQALDLSRIDPRPSSIYEHALARFEVPLCPAVYGLKRGPAEEIVTRIRANAQRLKVRLAKARCTPNLMVAFVDDGRSYLGELQRKYPQLFDLVEKGERGELLAPGEPVRVWSTVVPRFASGAPVRRWKGKWLVPTRAGMAAKLMLPSRTDIDSAVVVFDRAAVLGMTAVQLADYATMRGLSHTRPAPGSEALATILGLFADDNRSPDELTSFDIGYLESLYWWEPNVPATAKLLGVRKRARKAAEGT